MWMLRVLFYQSDIDVTLQNSDVHTALLKAPENGHRSIVCELLERNETDIY